jgi:G:T/U-mismatch repair DNA glycosylase
LFFHKHPYEPFIKENSEKLIVGTLPPPRFTTGELIKQDVDFCYGSYYNSLWLYIDKIHDLGLDFENTNRAIEQRKSFLIEHKIGVCDIVDSCERDKVDASDLGMKNIQLRNLIDYLKKFPTVHTLLFTGGNSKNGPEYFFRKHLKEYNLKLEVVSDSVPRIHQFKLDNRIIKTVSLTSPSGSANRSIGSMEFYKRMKIKNSKFTTFDFRVLQYKKWF